MTSPEDIAPARHLDPDERDIEASPEDAVEQATVADPSYDEPTVSDALDAPDWDAYEQSRVVELEDDYR